MCFFGVESPKEFLWEAMGGQPGVRGMAGLEPWEGGVAGNEQWKKGYSVRLEQKSQKSFKKSQICSLRSQI